MHLYSNERSLRSSMLMRERHKSQLWHTDHRSWLTACFSDCGAVRSLEVLGGREDRRGLVRYRPIYFAGKHSLRSVRARQTP